MNQFQRQRGGVRGGGGGGQNQPCVRTSPSVRIQSHSTSQEHPGGDSLPIRAMPLLNASCCGLVAFRHGLQVCSLRTCALTATASSDPGRLACLLSLLCLRTALLILHGMLVLRGGAHC